MGFPGRLPAMHTRFRIFASFVLRIQRTEKFSKKALQERARASQRVTHKGQSGGYWATHCGLATAKASTCAALHILCQLSLYLVPEHDVAHLFSRLEPQHAFKRGNGAVEVPAVKVSLLLVHPVVLAHCACQIRTGAVTIACGTIGIMIKALPAREPCGQRGQGSLILTWVIQLYPYEVYNRNDPLLQWPEPANHPRSLPSQDHPIANKDPLRRIRRVSDDGLKT